MPDETTVKLTPRVWGPRRVTPPPASTTVAKRTTPKPPVQSTNRSNRVNNPTIPPSTLLSSSTSKSTQTVPPAAITTSQSKRITAPSSTTTTKTTEKVYQVTLHTASTPKDRLLNFISIYYCPIVYRSSQVKSPFIFHRLTCDNVTQRNWDTSLYEK